MLWWCMHQAHLFHVRVCSTILESTPLFLLPQVCWEEPLSRGLDALSAQLLVTARRRDQGGLHAQVLPIAGPQSARGLPSVNPLAHWSFEDCLDYAAKYRIPLHPLLARGFPAVGDAHSTVPVPQDEFVAFVDYNVVGRREVRAHSGLRRHLLSSCVHACLCTHARPSRHGIVALATTHVDRGSVLPCGLILAACASRAQAWLDYGCELSGLAPGVRSPLS